MFNSHKQSTKAARQNGLSNLLRGPSFKPRLVHDVLLRQYQYTEALAGLYASEFTKHGLVSVYERIDISALLRIPAILLHIWVYNIKSKLCYRTNSS